MKEDIIKLVKENNVQFIKLQFTDIFGTMKNINIPVNQLEKALNNEIMFDGSSIDGFARIEESDMYLYPDLNTFRVLPSRLSGDIVEAIIICDVYNANNEPFNGDPRYILKKVTKAAEEMGYQMNVGPELEFFLFKLDENGQPTLKTNDTAKYFDLSTIDKGHIAKREMCIVLKELGFEIEATHHECAPGQHEIDFKYSDALKAADNIMIFKSVVKQIAEKYGLYASFMPKPIQGVAGSGMHLNQSLFCDGKNTFNDENDALGLSQIAYNYIAGILEHAKAMCVITNPTINSYKRLVAGYEAPINIAWAAKNRSPLIRIPTARGKSTRIEMRNPDPSCNPYLAIAVSLAAGLDGIKNKKLPPENIESNIYQLDEKTLTDKHIEVLPENLKEALDYMFQDKVITEALGEHATLCIKNLVRHDWSEYIKTISCYELDKYISL